MEKMYHTDGMLSKDAVLKGLQAGGRRKDRRAWDDRSAGAELGGPLRWDDVYSSARIGDKDLGFSSQIRADEGCDDR